MPITLETYAMATILVLSVIVCSASSSVMAPSFCRGMNFRVAPVFFASCCHGMKLL
ncbi:hypothetical protein D3C79_1054210 [compost metagenome]